MSTARPPVGRQTYYPNVIKQKLPTKSEEADFSLCRWCSQISTGDRKKNCNCIFFFSVLTWRGVQRWRRCERCGSLSASACSWQTEQNGLTLGREPFVCGTDAEQTLHSRCVDVEASGRRYAVIKNSVIACGLLPPLYMFLLFLFSPWKWSLAPLLPSVQCGTDAVSLRGDNVNPHRLIATVSVEVSGCVFLALYPRDFRLLCVVWVFFLFLKMIFYSLRSQIRGRKCLTPPLPSIGRQVFFKDTLLEVLEEDDNNFHVVFVVYHWQKTHAPSFRDDK